LPEIKGVGGGNFLISLVKAGNTTQLFSIKKLKIGGQWPFAPWLRH